MKILIGYILLIIVTLMTAVIGILKRKAILKIGEVSLKPNFWFNAITNFDIIKIFLLSIIMFLFTLAIFSLITADKVLVMSWTLTIPAFLLTVVLNNYLLKESFDYSKIPYILLLFISVLIGTIGARGYIK